MTEPDEQPDKPGGTGPSRADQGKQPDEQPDEPIGWMVLDPDGNVVATGGQTGIEATADTGGVAGDVDGSD